MNKQRQTEYLEKSEIQILTLLKHEEVLFIFLPLFLQFSFMKLNFFFFFLNFQAVVMNVKNDLIFPIYLQVELLLTES